MALIEHTIFGKVDKVKIAIDRIKMFDPITTGLMDEAYYVAYSGGKDSDAIRILCELSGVKFDLVHNLTTVDAPETVSYIRSIPGIKITRPKYSMWELIVKKKIPPTRIIRYCCKYLKEHGGHDRFVITGVRWEESSIRRNNRNSLEILPKNLKNKIILNADNDESRRLFETCKMNGKRVLNPIVDWTTNDVWEFLDYYGCKSNPLYYEGYNRIGCIGCPMGSKKQQEKEFERWPKYKISYLKSFEKMLIARENEKYQNYLWPDAEAVYNWWISDKPKLRINEGQYELWEG